MPQEEIPRRTKNGGKIPPKTLTADIVSMLPRDGAEPLVAKRLVGCSDQGAKWWVADPGRRRYDVAVRVAVNIHRDMLTLTAFGLRWK